MYVFFLAAILLTLAAVLLYAGGTGRTQKEPGAGADAAGGALERLEDSGTPEMLGKAVEELLAVMDHPELGGPGFLSIQFPPGSLPTVSAQFPNINEALYRRVVRQELDRGELAAAGVPEALLERSPVFAAESGGMVLLSVEIRDVEPGLLELLSSRRDRADALAALAAALGRRFPGLSVRCLGADLLLTPLAREKAGQDAAF